MKTCLFPTLILLTLAPFAARADEPPPAQADETPATKAEELPYGAGYEARERLAQGEQQVTQDQGRSRQTGAARARERDRSDAQRASTQRESRREAREQRGQRGPTRH